jgi:hypothetical protein
VRRCRDLQQAALCVMFDTAFHHSPAVALHASRCDCPPHQLHKDTVSQQRGMLSSSGAAAIDLGACVVCGCGVHRRH